MSLLKEIHTWSISLTPCLRDALRRLIQNDSLEESDFDELFALLKTDVGISDPAKRVAKPLELSHLPSIGDQDDNIRLLSIRKMNNVNRIAPEQTIDFVPVGLTVVYGDNGTGKSGYSRVLKHICRARATEKVLPNAYLSKKKQGTPEAEIHIEVKGAKKKFDWKSTSAEIPEMAAISVFDSQNVF